MVENSSYHTNKHSYIATGIVYDIGWANATIYKMIYLHIAT